MESVRFRTTASFLGHGSFFAFVVASGSLRSRGTERPWEVIHRNVERALSMSGGATWFVDTSGVARTRSLYIPRNIVRNALVVE